jgi:hypothetical protein
MRNYRTVLFGLLTGICLVVLSAFLTLAIDQAVFLSRLYSVSASPSPVTDFSQLRRLSFGVDLLIGAIIAATFILLVRGRHRRLLPVSIIAILIFVALNLHSGRHVLPQLLIWPSPISLAEQHAQAVAANDLETALRLAGGSENCQTLTTHVFQDHRAKLRQRDGNDHTEMSIQDTSLMRIVTFYDKPVPQTPLTMRPVPSQLVSVMAEMENGKATWFSLKMRYTPFFGTRYICGQDIGD